MTSYRIGVDVGGHVHRPASAPRPTASSCWRRRRRRPPTSREGVLAGLDAARRAPRARRRRRCSAGPRSIVHGTTTGDNTMIQMTGAPTGLLVTAGSATRSSCAAATRKTSGTRRSRRPPPIARRRVRLEIPERLTAEGDVDTPLDEERGPRSDRRLRAFGVTSIAVVLPALLPEPGARAAGPRAHPRGVPRRRAVSLSHEVYSEAAGVRAHVDHARQRLRRAADRPLPRPARSSA